MNKQNNAHKMGTNNINNRNINNNNMNNHNNKNMFQQNEAKSAPQQRHNNNNNINNKNNNNNIFEPHTSQNFHDAKPNYNPHSQFKNPPTPSCQNRKSSCSKCSMISKSCHNGESLLTGIQNNNKNEQ